MKYPLSLTILLMILGGCGGSGSETSGTAASVSGGTSTEAATARGADPRYAIGLALSNGLKSAFSIDPISRCGFNWQPGVREDRVQFAQVVQGCVAPNATGWEWRFETGRFVMTHHYRRTEAGEIRCQTVEITTLSNEPYRVLPGYTTLTASTPYYASVGEGGDLMSCNWQNYPAGSGGGLSSDTGKGNWKFVWYLKPSDVEGRAFACFAEQSADLRLSGEMCFKTDKDGTTEPGDPRNQGSISAIVWSSVFDSTPKPIPAPALPGVPEPAPVSPPVSNATQWPVSLALERGFTYRWNELNDAEVYSYAAIGETQFHNVSYVTWRVGASEYDNLRYHWRMFNDRFLLRGWSHTDYLTSGSRYLYCHEPVSWATSPVGYSGVVAPAPVSASIGSSGVLFSCASLEDWTFQSKGDIAIQWYGIPFRGEWTWQVRPAPSPAQADVCVLYQGNLQHCYRIDQSGNLDYGRNPWAL